MTAMAGTISDYGNNFDFRSMLESKLNKKKSELGETELSIKKIGGSRISSSTHRGVEGGGDRLSSFKGRLGPVVSRGGRPGQQALERRTSINSRLGPRVSHSLDDGFVEENDISNAAGETNGFGGEVTGRGSVMSRIVVEQKSREDALAEQKQDKKENQRNKRMFGSILGTLQQFQAAETKDKDRELKKRKIEAKIDQKTEKERAEAIKQKQELFEDKKKKELEIKVLQVQMKRAEEFEIWERSKRKEQKYIRTKTSSTKIYYLPKNHNDSTLTALENTMDEIDEEIRVARELFEEELQKISGRAEQNPAASIEDLEGDDNSGDENETDRATTKSIVSAIRKPNEEQFNNSKELYDKKDRHDSKTRMKIENLNGIIEHNGENGEPGIKHLNDMNIKTENNANGDVFRANNPNVSEANPIVTEERTEDSTTKTHENHITVFNKNAKEEHKVKVTKTESKDAEKETRNSIGSPVKTSNDPNEQQENNTRLKRKSAERSSPSLSPNSNKRKLHRSGSSKDKNSKESRDRSPGRTQKKKNRDSSITRQPSKKSRQGRKRKDSSSDSSSASSSSGDQSESDKSSTNSSSYSDTSDESSSESDAKKKNRKSSLKNSKNKKVVKDKIKDNYSSKNQKRDSKVSRKNSSRKSSKKYSDSSD